MKKPCTTAPSGDANITDGICPDTPRERGVFLTLNEIQVRAHSKWVAAGRPEGDNYRFWLEAEEELGCARTPTQ